MELDRIDVDRQDFISCYRSKIDLKSIDGPRQLRTIRDFLSHQVRGFVCSLPRDNASVTETLRRAVREGAVVPYIERNWIGAPRVLHRMYAPQSWPKRAGGGTGFVHSAEPFAATRRAAIDVMERRSKVAPTEFGSGLRSAGERDGFDWRRAAETVTGAVSADGEGDVSSPMQNVAESTPLSDAEPFQYAEDSSLSDVIEIAARGVSETDESECFAAYEFDLDQCNVVIAMTRDPRSLAMCRETAFSNYQQCRGF